MSIKFCFGLAFVFVFACSCFHFFFHDWNEKVRNTSERKNAAAVSKWNAVEARRRGGGGLGTIEKTIKDQESAGAQPCGALAFLAEGPRLLLLHLPWEEETDCPPGGTEWVICVPVCVTVHLWVCVHCWGNTIKKRNLLAQETSPQR